MRYVTAKEAREYFKCSSATLHYWKKAGKLKVKEFSQRKVLYDIDSYDNYDKQPANRKTVIYARVSNASQTEDLNRQINVLKDYINSKGIHVAEIYKDIASGMNCNRKEFNMMLDEIFAGKIDTVYITYKDRLTRFGFEYFKNIFEKFETKIEVIDSHEETEKSFQDELTEDLISIIHHYSMKLYSRRRKKFKDIQKIIASDEELSSLQKESL